MATESVTIQVDPANAAILQALQDKAEEHGLTLDALSLPISRQVLELLVIQAHQADLITEPEVMEILGFEDREELYAFFKRYDLRSQYTNEDFEAEGAALEELLAKNDR